MLGAGAGAGAFGRSTSVIASDCAICRPQGRRGDRQKQRCPAQILIIKAIGDLGFRRDVSLGLASICRVNDRLTIDRRRLRFFERRRKWLQKDEIETHSFRFQ
jgi:hypothetical protein